MFYNCMLKLMELQLQFFVVQHCPFKTHDTLYPFINKPTSNNGWALPPQAAISPECTLTGEKKNNPLIQVVTGWEGHYNPLMLTKYTVF